MVEFKTSYDKETLDKLTKIQITKTNPVIKVFMALFIIIGMLILVLAYDKYVAGETYYFYLFSAVFSIGFGILYPATMRKAIIKSQEKQNKSSATTSAETEILFKFDKDRLFILTSKGDKFRSAVESDYDYLFRVYEDDTTYILYISQMECYILNKSNLVSGSQEEFMDILHSHLSPEKFEKKTNLKIKR